MSTLKVEVCQVEKVENHPNADRLDIINIKGWQVVSKKGIYKEGDLCIYIPIDSILPQNIEEIIFPPDSKVTLHKSRVKTIKLRGAISQGLIVTPALLQLDNVKIGDDVTDRLGITKYEPPPPSFSGMSSTNKIARKKNPFFYKYTGIENFKNYNSVFKEGDPVVVTEKIHGCLQADTLISLADGTKKTIKEIVDNKLEVEVLGLDKDGNVVPTKIINWFNNGITDEWFTVRIDEKKVNFSPNPSIASYNIVCTSNHKFYNPISNKYVKCSELKEGDDLLKFREFSIAGFFPKIIISIPTVGKIEPIDLINNDKTKYDIETETHNFVADNVVVHNSNFRAGYVPFYADTIWKKIKKFFRLTPKYEFVYGSHNVQLQNKFIYTGYYKRNIYAETVTKYNLSNILKPGEVIYGEVYGDGIQKNYSYGCQKDEIKFVAFDLMKDEKYVDFEQLKDFCKTNELPLVPVLYEGPFLTNFIKELSQGKSTLCEDQKITEGVVIKPHKEEHIFMGRKILKLINDDYLMQKDNTDFH